MINQYEIYFKDLIQNHSDLGDNVFRMIALEEVFDTNYRSTIKAKDFAFDLFIPQISFENGTMAVAEVEAGFSVIKHQSSRKESDFSNVFSECLEIGSLVIRQMMLDSQSGHDLFAYSVNTIDQLKLKAIPIKYGGDGSYHGYIFTFSFNTKFDLCEPKIY